MTEVIAAPGSPTPASTSATLSQLGILFGVLALVPLSWMVFAVAALACAVVAKVRQERWSTASLVVAVAATMLAPALMMFALVPYGPFAGSVVSEEVTTWETPCTEPCPPPPPVPSRP